MAPRSLLLATAGLLVLVPVAAAADLLGARLSIGSVVTVESHATIPTTVSLTVTGAYSLDETTFRLDPGQIREIGYHGTGRGTVTAHMAPVTTTGDGAAIELTAHIVPATPRGAPIDLGAVLLWSLGLGLVLVTATAVLARRVYRRAARQ